MRKLLLTTCIALSLTGCGTTSIFQGGSSLTALTNNPITPQALYEAENALIVVETGMLTYKRLCLNGAIPTSCRGVLVKLRNYNRAARPLIAQVRTFVKANDQINAVIVFEQLKQIIQQLHGEAVAAGVQI